MKKITISKQQAKTFARVINPDIPDVKEHDKRHFERYFPFWLEDSRKENGKLPMKRMPPVYLYHPYDYCHFCPRSDD